jgi:hypothetical protein
MNRVAHLRGMGVAMLLAGWIARYVFTRLKSEPKDNSWSSYVLSRAKRLGTRFGSFSIHVGVFLLLITIW